MAVLGGGGVAAAGGGGGGGGGRGGGGGGGGGGGAGGRGALAAIALSGGGSDVGVMYGLVTRRLLVLGTDAKCLAFTFCVLSYGSDAPTFSTCHANQ